MLTQQEKLASLRLIRSKNVGPRTFWELLRMFGTASNALEKASEIARRGGGNLNIEPLSTIEKEIELTTKFGASFIFEASSDYPSILKNIEDKPPVLIAKGRTDLLKKKGNVAIVGSRNASANGCVMADDLAKNISAAGHNIISGLARGIDTAAHKAAINHGTIAVIAGGINSIYPPENKSLFNDIYEKGLVLTEHHLNCIPIAKYFPQRNRIISGMSLGVIVVEAAIRSGTLITARYALEQGREVFAVPGSPLDPRCQGTNQLIKSGAQLIENADDVLNSLNTTFTSGESSLFDTSKAFSGITTFSACEEDVAPYRKLLLEKLSFSPTNLDDIAKHSNIPIQILNYLVVELELAGKVERLFGNKIIML